MDDIFAKFGVSPNEYEYDAASDTIRRKPDTFDERWNLPVRPQMDTLNEVPNVPTNVAVPSPQAYIPEQPKLDYRLPVAGPDRGDIPQSILPDWLNQPFSAGTERGNAIFGLGNEERYQTFPERMVRSGATLASDLTTGKLPVDLRDEVTMEPNAFGKMLGMTNTWSAPSPHGLIGRAQDLSGMAGMSTMGIKPGTASVGSGAMRKYKQLEKDLELKDPDYVYHATNMERADEIANSGKLNVYKPHEFTDQSVWPDGAVEKRNYFGTTNPWHFSPEEGTPTILRVKKDSHDFKKESTGDIYSTKPILASKIEYLDSNGKWNVLTEDSKAATAIGALNQSGFYSNLERTIANSKVQKGTPEQWTNYLKNQPGIKPEELEFGLQGLPDKVLTKDQLANHIAENNTKLNEVWKGDLKFNKNSQYALPEVIKAAKESGTNPGELEMTLANDGNAYRALTKKFPKLGENEDWAAIVAKDVFGGDTMPKGTTKYSSYQLPGGENYRELLLTLPDKIQNRIDQIQVQIEDIFNRKPRGKAEFANATDEALFYKLSNEQKELIKQSGENPSYRSSHWDEPNPVAHIRMNDRDIPLPLNEPIYKVEGLPQTFKTREEASKARDDAGLAGKASIKEQGNLKTLHIEEIQSDWHQAGRKYSYNGEREVVDNKVNALETKLAARQLHDKLTGNKTITEKDINEFKTALDEQAKFREKYGSDDKTRDKIPNAPFKKTWDELALKRVLTEAVKNNYDAVSWTPGEAQAKRYDLSNQLKELQYRKIDGKYEIAGTTKNGDGFNHPEMVTAEKLPDVVGKEMAEKIINDEGKKTRGQNYDGGYFDGIDLKLEHKGMKAFYDKMLVDKANALVKKMGGKVEYEHLPVNKSKIDKDQLRPDEIATEKYAKDFDAITEELKPLRKQYEDLRYDGRDWNLKSKEMTALEMQILIKETKQDGIHGQMINDTYNRAIKAEKGDKIPIIKITPQMREKIAKEGFPLYSAGVPTFTPVDGNPHEPRLVKINYNPFENAP